MNCLIRKAIVYLMHDRLLASKLNINFSICPPQLLKYINTLVFNNFLEVSGFENTMARMMSFCVFLVAIHLSQGGNKMPDFGKLNGASGQSVQMGENLVVNAIGCPEIVLDVFAGGFART